MDTNMLQPHHVMWQAGDAVHAASMGRCMLCSFLAACWHAALGRRRRFMHACMRAAFGSHAAGRHAPM